MVSVIGVRFYLISRNKENVVPSSENIKSMSIGSISTKNGKELYKSPISDHFSGSLASRFFFPSEKFS